MPPEQGSQTLLDFQLLLALFPYFPRKLNCNAKGIFRNQVFTPSTCPVEVSHQDLTRLSKAAQEGEVACLVFSFLCLKNFAEGHFI